MRPTNKQVIQRTTRYSFGRDQETRIRRALEEAHFYGIVNNRIYNIVLSALDDDTMLDEQTKQTTVTHMRTDDDEGFDIYFDISIHIRQKF